MEFFHVLLIISTILSSTFAALPQCANGVSCPTGGIWSEWTSSENCSTDCGSCSKLYYRRTCLSESANCNCTGDTSRYYPCNSQVCKYPSQRSCCIPYLPMVINSTLQCGPFVKDPSSSGNTPCCPVNGTWSEWSGFVKVSDGWMQTRECVSKSAGCPCSGDSNLTKPTCPCPAMQTDQQVADACGTALWQKNNATTNDITCVRTATLVASNNDVVACHPYAIYQNYQFAPYVLFSPPVSNTCPFDRSLNCEARKERNQDGETMNITFTCDLDTLQWLYDYDGSVVDGYVQLLYGS